MCMFKNHIIIYVKIMSLKEKYKMPQLEKWLMQWHMRLEE